MRILSILGQKPYATGSGVYATELIRRWSLEGHKQALICGIDARESLEEYRKSFEGLALFPLRFNTEELPFDPMGMSDVMPYPSTRYRDLASERAKRLERAFSEKIAQAIEKFEPELIVCHHLYFATMLAVELTDLPIAAICHGTCLRQLGTHDFERERIISAIQRIPRIFALQEVQRREIISLGAKEERVEVVGNGYNSEIFFIRSTEGHPCQGNVGLKDEADESGHEQRDRDSCSRLFLDRPIRLAYAGKISKSKGIPSLLRAIKRIEGYKLELHLAGGASDPEEYAEIVEQAKGSRHSIRFLGPLTQPELSELYASCDLFVFPSYYEGLGLAVFEAMACGLRVVVSNTEGLQDWICKNIKDPPILFVKLPMMRAVDIPVEEELPRYEEDFANAIVRQIEELEKADFAKVSIDMSMLSWDSIARRILKSF